MTTDTVMVGDTFMFGGAPHQVVAMRPTRKGKELTFHNGAQYMLPGGIELIATRRFPNTRARRDQ
ncbi:hypothetical protein ACTWP5_28615 [Streptomyces sp. 4N509B]|uniref:hypothetical protein n=1 Tax=Streptomyces sp. 4N509B TaxID=3457413 RepID=UPI003FD5E718